jgi:hypothetical protein
MDVFSKVATHGVLAVQAQIFEEMQIITMLKAVDISINIRPLHSFTGTGFGAIFYFMPHFFPFFTPAKWTIANRALFIE